MALGFDPYAVLGVSRDATSGQIAQARHRLVRRYHPDVNPAYDAAARFDEVQRAFHLLSDQAARAEYDRAHGLRGAARTTGNPGQATSTAASRFSVIPVAVNFGIVEPGKPGSYKDVVVYWTGAPPARISAGPGSEWSTVLNTGRLALSGIVFHLRAQVPAGAATGRRHGQLRITLDDTVVTVPLTAEIGVRVPPSPNGSAKRAQSGPWWGRALGAVISVTLSVVGSALFSHPHSGGSGAGAASASAASASASASASAFESEVNASYAAAASAAAASWFEVPPTVKPVNVPQAREASIGVQPVFTVSGTVLGKAAESRAGLSGPPALHGSELLVPVAQQQIPKAELPNFCVKVTVPAAATTPSEAGAQGKAFIEYPLGTTAVRGGTALTFPAVLPGEYAYHPDSCTDYGPGATNLGTVAVRNLGVVEGVGWDIPTNAMVVFGSHSWGATTTLTYGVIGGTASSQEPGLAPPADNSCIDTFYDSQGTSSYWQPVKSLISQRVTGAYQWLETGTMIFRNVMADSPHEFYYDCTGEVPFGFTAADLRAGLLIP